MPAARRPPGLERWLPALVTGGFFLTGFTALAAEVVLNRLLRYVFGSGHVATATVLAAYMAGLSAGAWLFGRLSARLDRKLAAYGFLELAVALFYVATPALYAFFKEVGVEAGRALYDSPGGLLAARFSLSFGFALAALQEAERLLGPSRFSPYLHRLQRALESGPPAAPPVPARP